MKRIKKLYKKYENRLSILAFLLGFTLDNFTLTRIDLWLDNLILATYLIVAGAGITVFQIFSNKKVKGWFSEKIIFLFPLIIQFAFGGLFSGYFVFYSRSASLASSWLFIVLIATLLIGNELFKKRYTRLEFQISIFFITLFSFAIFYIPVLSKTIGAVTFLVSGIVSLVAIRLFVFILSRFIPKKIEGSKKSLMVSILSIYFIFNFLYFTNIIPPIPLSLKDSGVFYLVERTPGVGYEVYSQSFRWNEFYKKYSDKVYVTDGDSIYFYDAVFAPTDLNTDIFHKWQYFDKNKKEWIESYSFKIPIVGGRDGGYRGYSFRSNLSEGKWRVDIVTARDQIIGRTNFEVVKTDIKPILEKELR